MPRYIQNPLEVEIEEVTKDNPLPFTKDGADYQGTLASNSLTVKFTNSVRLALIEGDFIVKRDDGSFYPLSRASVEANFTLKE